MPCNDLRLLLPPWHLQKLVLSWLQEDVPNLDVGGLVVGDKNERALLVCKSEGVLAGVPFFDEIFRQLECSTSWAFAEGQQIKPGSIIAEIHGKLRNILLGERVSLNCLSRASGIASLAYNLVQRGKLYGWTGRIAGTRKTTPGFRLVEKYALQVAGADTHRYDLSSLVMLKDNHIWSAQNITQAVRTAKEASTCSSKIEVECRSLEEAKEAIEAGCDIVMLDNFTSQSLKKTAEQLKQEFPHALIEASGGINESNIEEYFSQHVDLISCGKLTQGYSTMDFSIKLLKKDKDPFNPRV